VLERFAESPRPSSCQASLGEIRELRRHFHAWYEPADGTVTFCYEYVNDIYKASDGAQAHGIDHDAAFEAASCSSCCTRPATRSSICSRPRSWPRGDAADQLAAFLLLRAGEGIARGSWRAAWMYCTTPRVACRTRATSPTSTASTPALLQRPLHGVRKQPASFKGWWTRVPAEGPRRNLRRRVPPVAYAVKKLIDPSVDVELAAQIKAAHKARWEGPKKVAEPAGTEAK